MQLISRTSVRTWGMTGRHRYAASISAICPNPECSARVVFTAADVFDDGGHGAVVCNAACPACTEITRFWTVRPKAGAAPAEEYEIFMYPSAKRIYRSDGAAEIPPQLQRAFASTIDSFNSSNYTATAVGARRTLEGIFQYLLPENERNKPLARLIEAATGSVDLAAPLKSLSHAIRGGGNLGAHFDPDKEPDENMARQMLELLDYLISYLYVLPKKITDLESNLQEN
jgi:hypothetical protein